jgi:S-adenosylmethionine synthetase
MNSLVISALDIGDDVVEIVERKGLGHPDTICDALAESFSRNLCREYRSRFGQILHYNVDKALLRGGRATAAFGGGTVLAPIEVYLAGRAVTQIGNEAVPIREIAVEGSLAWLRDNLHALDAERHVRIHELVQPGSQDLQAVFSGRSKGEVHLSNDTSIGVGYAPMSRLEQLVLTIERQINARDRNREHPAWGEDVKVMGVRNGAAVQLTVACAMIGRHIARLEDYLGEKAALDRFVRELAAHHGFDRSEVAINAADDPASGTIYLTVTGTSGEAGDDGEVGRGNRVNGLITPCRPMSLEAAAGKNPASHVGKMYNVVAREIAEALVSEVPEIAAAHCLMVSRIGTPVTQPVLVEVKLATREGLPVVQLKPRVEEIVTFHLSSVPQLIEEFVAGTIEVF